MEEQSTNSKKFILIAFLLLALLLSYFATRETPENKLLKKHLQEKETTVFWYDINVPQYQSAVVDHNAYSLPNIDSVIKEYTDFYMYSPKALISQLVYDGYDVDKAIASVNKSKVNWYKSCLELCIDLRDNYKFSKSETADMLIEAGFDSKTVFKVIKESFY